MKPKGAALRLWHAAEFRLAGDTIPRFVGGADPVLRHEIRGRDVTDNRELGLPGEIGRAASLEQSGLPDGKAMASHGATPVLVRAGRHARTELAPMRSYTPSFYPN